ncbi:hypothetical protein ACE1TH_12480 [Shouchella sp. JSM 1781072]|uniref:hypothetical protein n=1 Tax=Shouchella sp. JSM 1781072 TaxID=3344581 RepID=UPI0035C08BB2
MRKFIWMSSGFAAMVMMSGCSSGSVDELEQHLAQLEEEYGVKYTVEEVETSADTDLTFEEFLDVLEDQAHLMDAMIHEENWHAEESEPAGIAESGTATETYTFAYESGDSFNPDVDYDNINKHISFAYDTDAEVGSSTVAAFTDVSEENSYLSGSVPNLEWEELNSHSSISSNGASLDLEAIGTWTLTTEWEEFVVVFSMDDEWEMVFESSQLE